MNTQPDKPTESRVIHWMARFLGGLAVTLLFAMMVLTFVDVLGRYFFNAPIAGGFEITEIMLATLIFAGLPLMTLNREHVTVDLFDRFMPTAIAHLRDGAISFLCAVMMGVVSYQMWLRAEETLDYGDTTALLLIPMAPTTYFMSAMSGLTALVFLFQAWLAWARKQQNSS